MNNSNLDQALSSCWQTLSDADKEKVLDYIDTLQKSFFDAQKLARLEKFKDRFNDNIVKDIHFWYLAEVVKFIKPIDLIPLIDDYLRRRGIDADAIKEYKTIRFCKVMKKWKKYFCFFSPKLRLLQFYLNKS